MTEERSEKCSELRKRSAIILRSPESGGEPVGSVAEQADSDEQLIELWLHGRSEHTQRAYRSEAERFMQFVAKPLRLLKLLDIQSFADHLGESLKESSQHRALSAVKSLLAFGHRIGYWTFDIGAAMKLPTFRDELADRILGETDVLRIISLEPNPRNRAILLTLYAGGFRVSEICQLKWRHLQERESAGQITVFGKGGKTRTVLMPQAIWDALQKLQQDASSEAPVFRSRKKGHLDESAVWRIVKKASERAGIDKEVSCHWFRHAHASHALDRGCPIHLVQATLGHSSISTTGRYLHARPTDSSGNYLPF
ncbi:tyrosine-type recombinase/integrase [Lignipirellula cremea]|uniref:Tyrosine recombinase XerD n=1 Tax=Lignipirellula cremea TaxID=2528010 RepID=A0A518DWL2_9BACT|nr:tyrosine-type recombinase/integrase [Lignipirellula cremea]QDU94064.1 Tyrosine recombinase XerD [Lignipirellula cremea]QDU96219.1 Tyrosine recombinase XerD [Lignipirellula cremea]